MKTNVGKKLASIALVTLTTLCATAGNLQWDSNPSTAGAQDGSGTWDYSTQNWTNGTANVAWTDGNTPVFGNGSGAASSGVFTVNLAVNPTVTNMTFNSAGTGNSYLITNGAITLLTAGSAVDSINVSSGVSAEINSIITTTGSSTANVRAAGGGYLKLSGGTAANPSSVYFLRSQTGATLELAGNMVVSNNLLASGGALVLSGTNLVLNSIYTGDSASYGGNATNVINVTGGVTTLNSTAGQLYLGRKNTTNSLNITGGSLVFAPGQFTSRAIYMSCDSSGSATVTNIVSTINISGTGLFDTGNGSGVVFMLANGTNNSATVNLDGGTLATARQITTGTIGTHTSIFNFNGGLLKANKDQENLMVGADSPFQALSGVYVRDGGAIFDTTAGNLGIMHDMLHSTNTLDSATDGGVTVSGVGGLTLGGNNSYTGPTVVKSGAICMASTTAVPGYLTGSVTVSNGAAFGVRLGSDSSIVQSDFDSIISSTTIFDGAGKNVAISVSGNGGTGVDNSTIGDLTGSRGLVKVGAGTLHMLGSYTYTGPTIVSGGKLQLISGATTPPSGGYVINPLGVIQVGDGSTPGSGDLGVNAVTNYGGKLTFNRPDSYVVTNLIQASAGGLFNIVAGSSVTFSNSGSSWADTFPQAGTMVFDLGAGGTVSASGKLDSSVFGGTTEIDWVSGNGNFTGVAIADNAAAVSALNIKGGNLYFNAAYPAWIGIKGTGSANVSNGTLTFGGTNDVKLGGDLQLATTGNGTLTISGGQCSINSAIPRLILGENTGASGVLNLYGGTLLSAGTILGGAGTSAAIFSGGTLKAGANNNNWVTNLSSALVSTNGLIVDDGGFAVTMNQALLHDSALVGADGGLTKNGNGTLYLNGVNTYTGSTAVTAGALGGVGTIAGNVTVNSGAAIAPGNGGVGTLTVNGSLTLIGNLVVNVDTSHAPSNSIVLVSGALSSSGTGTVTVNNLGANALVVGQKFYPFNGSILAGGGSLTVSGGGAGVTWLNHLATDGSIQVATVGVAVPPSFPPGGISRQLDGSISLTATGAVGTAYSLWATTNLALTPVSSTWTLLTNGTITTTPFIINDAGATNKPQRFYLFSTP
ncbi:MAG TPA: autotransporter-associated beta strand repeat-containing protein [bacterium]|nr:autotransporter-associated beta strand repeat-containing protein [bacterium]